MMNFYRQIGYFFPYILAFLVLLSGCNKEDDNLQVIKTVPHEGKWGIYRLDISQEHVSLIYSSNSEIFTSVLSYNTITNTLLFAQKIDGDSNENFEICHVKIDDNSFQRITNNAFWDLYPVWSSDGNQIAFLSFRESDLDIYMMNSNGSNVHKFFDSGYHDADIDWKSDKIVFTSNHRIWSIKSDGSQLTKLTEPPKAGQWGNANLPFGDYDPRLSHDGNKVVFERLEDDTSPHGNYNLLLVSVNDTSNVVHLTNNGYSQGLASWSASGNKIIYTVSAIGTQGYYDLYMINPDGSNMQNITPDYFPIGFLCHTACFSSNESIIYFIGEWY